MTEGSVVQIDRLRVAKVVWVPVLVRYRSLDLIWQTLKHVDM